MNPEYNRAKRIMQAERADYPQMDATQLATLTALSREATTSGSTTRPIGSGSWPSS
jgi:hypothetical protein